MRILVIGGTGGFGSTICRLLADDGHVVTAASRTPPGEPLHAGVSHVVLDRSRVRPSDLEGHDLIVDAAGPFQGQGQSVMDAAIATGIHYVDIADDRRFTCAARLLDPRAKAAGIVLVSGASSVPALSSAAALQLADGMDRIDRVDISISAGADAVFGPAVLAAMLAGAGRSVPWRHGGRPKAMTLPRHVTVEAVGHRVERQVLVCDVPDVTLLPDLLPGTPEVRFRAGSELAAHNLAMRFVSWCVRRGIVRDGRTFLRAASIARAFTAGKGSGRSFMNVELLGRSSEGMERRTWSILAHNGLGPTIPCLAVPAVVRAIEEGRIVPGAHTAAGLLSVDEILSRLPPRDHDVVTTSDTVRPLYERILMDDWRLLPEAVRTMHSSMVDAEAIGSADVTRGRGPLASIIAAVMRFPRAGRDVPVRVSFEIDDGVEKWTRRFGASRFSSVLRREGDRLEERFGPLRFRFLLDGDARGIRMVPAGWSLWRLPLPAFMAPDGVATETEEDGMFVFDVPIRLPIIGDVVHYRGRLGPPRRRGS